jgi:putative toxin-antitoxin system antitoxin component (TIGR02293 family)
MTAARSALSDTVPAAQIAQALGSPRLSGISTDLALDVETRKGLPSDVIGALKTLGFTIDELAAVTANSTRTINRWVSKNAKEARLNLATSDRLIRLATVIALGEHLLGSRAETIQWLRAPNRYLGNASPLGMLETEFGRDLVVESMYAVAYGATG